MVDTRALKTLIKEKGIKFQHLSKKMNISPNTFTKKMNNLTQFTDVEMKTLRDELEMDSNEVDAILFADNFAKMANMESKA